MIHIVLMDYGSTKPPIGVKMHAACDVQVTFRPLAVVWTDRNICPECWRVYTDRVIRRDVPKVFACEGGR